MNINIILAIITSLIRNSHTVRLHNLFQFIDGFKSEHNLRGFLHVGNDYAIFLQKPNPHDKFLTYELYEARNVPDIAKYKPRLLAITKVPLDYIKDQLKIFREELYKARHVDDNVVPGTQVQTLREWQIERALNFHNSKGIFGDKLPVLRTVL